MAEIVATFAALSSFLQVLDFTASAVKCLHSLVTEKDAHTSEDDHAVRLAADLDAVLKISNDLSNMRLEDQIEASAAVDNTITTLKKQCQDIAEEMRRQLRRLYDDAYLSLPDGEQKQFRSLQQTFRDSKRAARDSDRFHDAMSKFKRLSRKAVFTTFHAPKIRKEVDEQRRHLQEVNGLLGTALLEVLLDSHKREVAAALEDMKSDLVDVREHLSTEQVRRLAKQYSEQTREINKHLLGSICFERMNARRSAISDVYQRTYRWAVEDDSHGLKEWLRKGSGIFWIAGKAGSGKSTLMNFLAGSEDVRRLLHQWCGDAQLISASFYFWFLGAPLQKTIPGLIRSILHQILDANKSLLPVVYPQYYMDILQPHDLPLLRDEDVMKAWDVIVAMGRTGIPGKKFCFFIDGLDEYHGDSLELIRLMRNLCSNENIKLCVSSRPWNPFRHAYESTTPNLRLEDLSYSDIKLYVAGQLREAGMVATSEEEVTELISEISSKAEGVFLWVYLVVKSVVSGFAEGDKIHMLRKRVKEFPADLEKFFQAILNRVDSVYRKHMSQALKLAYIYAQPDPECVELAAEAFWIDFYLLSCYEEGLEDATFPFRLKAATQPHDSWMQMRKDTRVFLSASCKDLLGLPECNREWDEQGNKVQFLHRTVYEFLQCEAMQTAIDLAVPEHFRNGRIFHLLRLARQTFFYNGESLHFRIVCTKKLYEESIVTQHQDWSESYIEVFESILLHFRRVYEWNSETPNVVDEVLLEQAPQLLKDLVRFGTFAFVIEVLQATSTRKTKSPVERGCVASSVMRAVLGCGTKHGFSASSVHLPLIATLLETGDANQQFLRNCSNSCNLECKGNGWTLFLSQWNSLDISTIDEPTSMQLWNIAKAFLQRHASLDALFCTRSRSAKRPAKRVTLVAARDLLFSCVPTQWLAELQSPVYPRIAELTTQQDHTTPLLKPGVGSRRSLSPSSAPAGSKRRRADPSCSKPIGKSTSKRKKRTAKMKSCSVEINRASPL